MQRPRSAQLKAPPATQTPLGYAYSLLARRDYSEARLTEKMRDKGFTLPAVTATVETLKHRGHLDDMRLAVALAQRFIERGFGPKGVRAKLSHRGLSEDTIESVLSTHAEQTHVAAAQRLVHTRYSPAALTDPHTRARAYRLLIRRGYVSRIAVQVLGELDDFGAAGHPD